MTQAEKRWAKVRRNPDGVQLAELEWLMTQSGWTLDRLSGSHRIWISPAGARLPLQPGRNGKAKGYQVRQFLRIYDDEQAAG